MTQNVGLIDCFLHFKASFFLIEQFWWSLYLDENAVTCSTTQMCMVYKRMVSVSERRIQLFLKRGIPPICPIQMHSSSKNKEVPIFLLSSKPPPLDPTRVRSEPKTYSFQPLFSHLKLSSYLVWIHQNKLSIHTSNYHHFFLKESVLQFSKT